MTRKRYTQKDVNVISKHVNKHPENLQKAFEDAAEELGRSKNSVCQSYYNPKSIVSTVRSNILTMSRTRYILGSKNSSSICRPKRKLKSIITQARELLSIYGK